MESDAAASPTPATEENEHPVEVVRVEQVLKHPGADALDLIPIKGFTCIVRKGEVKVGDLMAYIEPDSLVPTDRPEFEFLKSGKARTHERISVRKLRGIYSQGLLLKAPPGLKEGDDAAGVLGVLHYQPPERTGHRGGAGGSLGNTLQAKAPKGMHPEYKIVNFYKHSKEILESIGDRTVVATEKCHGTNFRAVAEATGEIHIGSHRTWKLDPQRKVPFTEKFQKWTMGLKRRGWRALFDWNMEAGSTKTCVYWSAFRKYPGIGALCKAHPEFTVYGEVFGPVQDLKYGGELQFAAFDIWHNKECRWLSTVDATAYFDDFAVPKVPVLYRGPMDVTKLKALAEGKTTLGNQDHVREGIVFCTEEESSLPKAGRLKFKIVGNGYLERKPEDILESAEDAPEFGVTAGP